MGRNISDRYSLQIKETAFGVLCIISQCVRINGCRAGASYPIAGLLYLNSQKTTEMKLCLFDTLPWFHTTNIRHVMDHVHLMYLSLDTCQQTPQLMCHINITLKKAKACWSKCWLYHYMLLFHYYIHPNQQIVPVYLVCITWGMQSADRSAATEVSFLKILEKSHSLN